MNRRKFIRDAGVSFVASLVAGVASSFQASQAQTRGSVTIQFLGHSAFLFTGDGRRILSNPFRPIGCTKGYRAPQVAADLVMISSRLLDEGALDGIPGNPRLLAEPGIYQFRGMQVQGIRMDHDRVGGRRFGSNIAWRWNQAGINFLHLGGAAAPITVEQRILLGRPDVLMVPVGGGPKAYNAAEAKAAIEVLNPKIIIPTQFRTQAADPNACDIQAVDEFLTVMQGTPVARRGNTIALQPADLPTQGARVELMSYPF